MYRAVSFQFRRVAFFFLMSFTLAIDHISLSHVYSMDICLSETRELHYYISNNESLSILMFFKVTLCVREFLFHNAVITVTVVSLFYSLYFPIITCLQEQKSEDRCFFTFYLSYMMTAYITCQNPHDTFLGCK